MHVDEIRKLQRAEPFTPFDIHLADGRVLHVPHPEFVYVPPGSTRTFVVTDDDGLLDIVNILVVTSLKQARAKKRTQRGTKKAG